MHHGRNGVFLQRKGSRRPSAYWGRAMAQIRRTFALFAEARRLAVVVVVSALIAACGDSGTPGGDTGSSTPIDINTTPSTEQQTTEAPPPGGGGSGSVSLPVLPVGGGSVLFDDGPDQCARVQWDSENITEGIEIAADPASISFATSGVFQVGAADICSEEGQAQCLDPAFHFDTNSESCSIPFTQIADSSVESVSVSLGGSVSCPDQPTCDSFKANHVKDETVLALVPHSTTPPSTDDSTDLSVPESTDIAGISAAGTEGG